MRTVFGLMVLVLCVGCTAPSMNVQRSVLRDAGDTGLTVALDAVDEAAVPNVQKEVEQTTKAILKFLEDGKVSDLTHSDAVKELEKLIPANLRPYFDAVLSVLGTHQVDVEKIGKDNVKRLQAACIGVLQGNTQYSLEDRPVEEE